MAVVQRVVKPEFTYGVIGEGSSVGKIQLVQSVLGAVNAQSPWDTMDPRKS